MGVCVIIVVVLVLFLFVINGIGCRRCDNIDVKKNLLKERNVVFSLEKRMREVNLSFI